MTDGEKKFGWKVKLLAASVVFNFLLSLGIFTNINKVEVIQDRLTSTQEQVVKTQKQLCDDSNEANLNQHKLWEGIIALTSKSGPSDPSQISEFRNLLDSTFPQHVCKL